MFYEKYWSGKNGHLSDFERKWPTLEVFIPRSGGIILDFGCGKGEILKVIKKLNPDADCIGLDVSGTALEAAREDSPGRKFFKIEDGGKFPLASENVDFVFSSEVLEHVYDTENAVSEIARVLKKRGQLLITVPFHGFIKNILIVLFNFDRHFDPVGAHVRFFSKKSLIRLLEKNGLRRISIGYYGRFFPISYSIFVLAQKY